MNNRTFGDIGQEFSQLENSNIVLLPVAYDGTSTWGKGADKGPEAFLHASTQLELYDIETDSEVYKKGIHLCDTLDTFASPEEMVDKVYTSFKKYLGMNKFMTMVGGEHSVTIGAIRAFNEHFENLTVLQLDAHADLRSEYLGSKYNHACALHEANKTTNLIQVGIRSMDISEKEFMNKENVYFTCDMANDEYWAENAVKQMTENVYITFDLDAFDPSIMPSTGTPEPGGLLWHETLNFLDLVFAEKNVVGFDIVELCPNEYDRSSDFMAVKLYYKMLTYKYFQKNKKEY